MNTTTQKNELIFGYSSGNLGEAKSLFTSMYLYLNSAASKKASIFDNLLAKSFEDLEGVKLKKLKFSDCIKSKKSTNENTKSKNNPLTNIVGDLNNINWKSVYKGFKEFSIPVNDNDSV